MTDQYDIDLKNSREIMKKYLELAKNGYWEDAWQLYLTDKLIVITPNRDTWRDFVLEKIRKSL